MLEKRIRHFLSLQHRTLEDLARYVGMSDTAIRNIYARNSCELSTLRKIAGFFNIPTTSLLEESDISVKINEIHIGQEIQAILKQRKMTKADLARKIGIARQNISLLLDKKDMDTAKLVSICHALNYNFFELYCNCDNGDIATIEGNNFRYINRSNVIRPADENSLLREQIVLQKELLEEKKHTIEQYIAKFGSI